MATLHKGDNDGIIIIIIVSIVILYLLTPLTPFLFGTFISKHIFNTPPSLGFVLVSPEFDSQWEEDIFSSPKF